MANNETEEALWIEEQEDVHAGTGLAGVPPGPFLVPFPKTDAERAALEHELTNYSRKATAKLPPEEAAAFYTRRYHICLALRGVTYDPATVPIPERQEEREALQHELENPNCYPPNKIREMMTREEETGWRIHRRQMMFALEGRPDDTTPAAKDAVRRCCFGN